MAKSKKQHINTVFQKHIDTGKAIGGVLMTLSALLLGFTFAFVNEFAEARAYLLLWGLIGLGVGFFILLFYMSKQELADQLNERLYAVWHYDAEIIYKFYRKCAKKEKPTRFYNGLITTAVLLLLTLIFSGNAVTVTISTVTLVLTILSAIISILSLPTMRYLFLVLRTAILGDATEVIFSRLGIWYCGKIYNFGKNGITYHRVERKEVYGMDTIIFYYTRKLGTQSTFHEIAIPVLPKMAYNADALVAEFNKSDILINPSKNK